jgi:diacylglycerol kinase family enzyme
VFAYLIGLFRAMRDLQPFFIDLHINGTPTWSGSVHQVSVGNGRFHGGGLMVAENAAIDDGQLNIYLVYPGRFWQLFASLMHLKFGWTQPAVLKRLSAGTVTLRTHRPRSVNADGELVTLTPAAFEVRRDALTVMVPRFLPPDHKGLSRLS